MYSYYGVRSNPLVIGTGTSTRRVLLLRTPPYSVPSTPHSQQLFQLNPPCRLFWNIPTVRVPGHGRTCTSTSARTSPSARGIPRRRGGSSRPALQPQFPSWNPYSQGSLNERDALGIADARATTPGRCQYRHFQAFWTECPVRVLLLP